MGYPAYTVVLYQVKAVTNVYRVISDWTRENGGYFHPLISNIDQTDRNYLKDFNAHLPANQTPGIMQHTFVLLLIIMCVLS